MPKSMSGRSSEKSVLAAGAVLWRPGPEGPARPEIAVIHRPRYDDWSLPKGKVDPGETEAVTAVARHVTERVEDKATTMALIAVLADAGYWHYQQMDELAAEGYPGADPTRLDQTKDPSTRVGRRALRLDAPTARHRVGTRALPQTPPDDRAGVRTDQIQPPNRSLPAKRAHRCALRVAISSDDPQPAQAPPTPDRRHRGLKRPQTRPESPNTRSPRGPQPEPNRRGPIVYPTATDRTGRRYAWQETRSEPSARRVSSSSTENLLPSAAAPTPWPGGGTCAPAETPWLVQRMSFPVCAAVKILVVGTLKVLGTEVRGCRWDRASGRSQTIRPRRRR